MVTRRLIEASPRAVLERSATGTRLRRRIGAIGGWSALLATMLVIVGLGKIVVIAAAVLAGAVLAEAGRRAGAPAAARRALLRGLRRSGELLRELAELRAPLAKLASEAGAAAQTAKLAAESGARQLRTTAARPIGDPRREALRLNALGLDLRRRGEPEEAIDCHRAALQILTEAGDRRDVALTQNNIALALARAGSDGEAIEHFEQAIAILRDLDDREREGQVIANLGVTHLRRGHAEQASELFHTALEKLEPDSAARRQVERQLARAS